MDTGKLNQIIEEKNERLERETLRHAEMLIEEIARQQTAITASNERIAELRKELTDLNIPQLDSKVILG
jgi:predicted nuclease with TOPRIM domain